VLSRPTSILSHYDYENPGRDALGHRATDCLEEEDEEGWEEGEPESG